MITADGRCLSELAQRAAPLEEVGDLRDEALRFAGQPDSPIQMTAPGSLLWPVAQHLRPRAWFGDLHGKGLGRAD